MNLPDLTTKQREIVDLIYKYRFLNRIQIQTMMKHKDYKTINLWLKDLREKHYVEWIYSTDFAEKTKPAIYYLGINGIRHIRALHIDIEYPTYPSEELRKRYRESSRSQTYIDRCQLIGDCVITLEQARDEESWPQSWYFYETRAYYLGESFFHYLVESELISPHLCYQKLVWEGGGDPYPAETYFLEVFDATLPRYRIKKRLSDYVQLFSDEAWHDPLGDDDEIPPIIQLVCPRTSDLIYAKRRTRGLLAEEWEHNDGNRPHIRFTTTDKLKKFGVTTQEIWEKA